MNVLFDEIKVSQLIMKFDLTEQIRLVPILWLGPTLSNHSLGCKVNNLRCPQVPDQFNYLSDVSI